jgi:glycogen operon protein
MRLMDGGGEFRVWSETAEEIDLLILSGSESPEITQTLPLERMSDGIFLTASELLTDGVRYVLRARGPEGPRHAFQPARNLLDPYARGLVRENPRDYHCVAIGQEFDWEGVVSPKTPLDQSIIYEVHVRGLSRINPAIPEEQRGTYAALGHPSTISYLSDLGVTAVELLPIHAFISEPRLVNLGLTNYWGYNSINFFTPHMRYASGEARREGPHAILRELKTSFRELHRAGIEVLIDVVYNHTAEGGQRGLTYSYRGLDNSNYYRQDDEGNYIDTTSCGNSLNFGHPRVQQLTLDSLRYWITELQVDGFRFDLAATLARDEQDYFDPRHPLLQAMQNDPYISRAKLIVEPWDLGHDGWQTGNFPKGFPEWNDRFRDSVRKFWLQDVGQFRASRIHNNGVRELASRISGSQDVMSAGSPLGNINFVTAHDGFTLWDLVSYGQKHNGENRESNRDGNNNNFSFNHGHEGETKYPTIQLVRRKAARNLLGTLLLSAGVPMITAGDERLKTQGGNNNAYCQDNRLSWLDWNTTEAQQDFYETVKHLIGLRKRFAGLRPGAFAQLTPASREHDQMLWFSVRGDEMNLDDWHNGERRTLQRLSYHLKENGETEGLLLVINGTEQVKDIRLPRLPTGVALNLLWDSALERPQVGNIIYRPGDSLELAETSMQLFEVN